MTTMTIKQLRAHLSKYDDTTEVYLKEYVGEISAFVELTPLDFEFHQSRVGQPATLYIVISGLDAEGNINTTPPHIARGPL